MKLLVFGRTGQVARALMERLPSDVQAEFLGRKQVDLRNVDAVRRAVQDTDADGLVNAAAWTAVDAAETEQDEVFAVNAIAPTVMAGEAARRNLPFVHLSSAYVFDGANGPYDAHDPTAPTSVYGRSKLAGENGVLAAGGRAVILRTCWVFGDGRNLVTALQGATGRRTIVDDQLAGPTPAVRLADAIYTILRRLRVDPSVAGVHHFTGTPDVSYAAFGAQIVAAAGLDVVIEPVSTASDAPVRRPRDARLDGRSLFEAFGIPRPDWTLDLPRHP